MKTNDLFQELRPTVWVGKRGATETMIEEIRLQLKKRKYVKIKWLRSTEIDPAEVARQAGADLVGVRGRTMVLAERGSGIRKA
ncbi:YhbY family RNA-binding protein [Methanofollis fontis]|uniref:RNA-binding protein n=1 Tax=Methanofollis fontis TaxID=2052832 RepID=A0A483CU54_9EURY|nr:YhbY family RNA-binding protein [Methanofollis fontis]TAJ44824.1 RNA-binding protein [Methanofollis fontis]